MISNNILTRKTARVGDGHDSLKNALVQGVVMGIPDLSVAICKGRTTLAWTGTAGSSNLIKNEPVRMNDRFGVGSITKTFVARVILELAAEGRLDLNRTAFEYLDLPIVRDIPNAGKATLRQLLNHQSGIPNWETQEKWIRKARGNQIRIGKVWGKTETLEYVRRKHISADHEPGVRCTYSNTNYTILGLVIEAVTGREAATEIRERILEPLDLKDTYLDSFEKVPGGHVHHYHYATPKFDEKAGVCNQFPEIRTYLVETTAANFSIEWKAGGMISTARDLVRWAQEIRNCELLHPSMHKEVFTYHPPEESASSQEEYMQGILKINEFYNRQAAFGHGGATLGFTSRMYWLDESDIVVVLLTNVGEMHSELRPSPTGLFYREVLFPVVLNHFSH